MKTDDATIHDLLTRGTVTVIDRERLKKRLQSGKPLRIKLGIDPTGPNIHLGHAVQLRKLRQFQDAGHEIIIIIGDWTARIGDPTDRNETRPKLTSAEVKINANKYLHQLFLILNKKGVKIVRQSTWFDKFTLQDAFDLLSKFSVSQLLDRDDFKKRLQSGIEVSYHEPIYALLQAYDSVMVKADLEIGATEQLFNLLRGRDLQRLMGQTEQDIMTMGLLLGLEGKRKMGKSFNNYIALLDPPAEMYGKVMSIPDNLILHYFELTTALSQIDIEEVKKQLGYRTTNPRDLKMRLARDIVTLYHSKEAAKMAEEVFVKVFRNKELPEDIKTYTLTDWPKTLAAALVDCNLASSMSEARRTIEQGGVKVNGAVEQNPNAALRMKSEVVIGRGKRQFCRLKRKK